MELLERYLNQIKKHLPLKDREDTLNELRSLILEEFDSKSIDSNDEDFLYEIIKRNGYPIEVASRYRNNEPLISSVLRPYFYMGIKIASALVPFGILLGTVLEFIDETESFKVMALLLEMAYSIPSIINSLIFSYGIIFVIFVILNRYARDEIKLQIPVFEPKNLPKIPTDVYKISIFEHVFEILMLVFFLYLLNYTEGLITISFEGVKYHLLNEKFNAILPFINLSLFFSLGISILQLSRRRKSKFSVTLNYVQTVSFGIILYLLASNDIFTNSVIDGYEISIIPNIFRIMLYIGSAATIIGGSISYIKTIKKMKSHL